MEDLYIRFIADALVIAVAVIGGGTFLLQVRKNLYQTYARAYMAGLSAYATAKLFSLLYVSTERPFETLGVLPKASYLDNPGFPSDHALLVATITAIVWLVTSNRLVTIILVVMTIAVSYGRVIALVHTPQDVIGGITAALVGVLPWYVRKHK